MTNEEPCRNKEENVLHPKEEDKENKLLLYVNSNDSAVTHQMPSFDNPSVIIKITTFHDKLMSFTFQKCTVLCIQRHCYFCISGCIMNVLLYR